MPPQDGASPPGIFSPRGADAGALADANAGVAAEATPVDDRGAPVHAAQLTRQRLLLQSVRKTPLADGTPRGTPQTARTTGTPAGAAAPSTGSTGPRTRSRTPPPPAAAPAAAAPAAAAARTPSTPLTQSTAPSEIVVASLFDLKTAVESSIREEVKTGSSPLLPEKRQYEILSRSCLLCARGDPAPSLREPCPRLPAAPPHA